MIKTLDQQKIWGMIQREHRQQDSLCLLQKDSPVNLATQQLFEGQPFIS